MNKLFLFLFIIPTIAFSQPDCSYNKRSSFFGERSREMNAAPAGIVRVFMDKNGFYYPDFYISDREIENNCSSLKEWYAANPQKLNLLCEQYKVEKNLDTDEKIMRLNDSVAQSYVRLINRQGEAFKTTDILIHGFRKKAYGAKDNISTYSVDDYESFEKQLMKNVENVPLFVEIYWDSKFITPVHSYKYKGFELFEKAGIPNADNVGLQLRRIVPFIKNDHINIITHSLGARVGCELLFNASKEKLADEQLLKTPGQNTIKICLIEPAISADLFDAYYMRNTPLDFKLHDNYKLGIIYNENDFVLLKTYKFGAFHIMSSPVEYGNTSLGCNYKSCISGLKQLFTEKYPNSVLIEPFDFSGVGADHRLYRYGKYEGFAKVVLFLN